MSAWWPPVPRTCPRMSLAVVMRDAGELHEGLPDAAAATASYRKVLELLARCLQKFTLRSRFSGLLR